ncbi:MAG: hypothetical protein RL308_3380, partial [Bacteroidota bacterium]|jgi:pectate lyase
LNTITKGSTTNLFYIKTVFNASLGLIDNVTDKKLILYPNPVTNQLNIASSNSKIEKVILYNFLGALVKSIEGDTRTIDMSALRSGSYLVRIITNQGIETQKIIKQ